MYLLAKPDLEKNTFNSDFQLIRDCKVVISMLGKLKANAKAGNAAQGVNFEEKGDAESEKRKVLERMSGEHVVRMLKMDEKQQRTSSDASNEAVSAESIPVIYSKTFKNKTSEARENGLVEADRFNLFEDFLPTDVDIADCELRSTDQDNIKVECDINFGISSTLSTQQPKLKVSKPRKAKQSTTEKQKYCRPKPIARANVIKKSTCTKPCRIKKLPAKLADTNMDSAKPVVDVIMPKIEAGPVPSNPSVIIEPLDVTLNSSNLTEIVNKNFINKVAKVENGAEMLANGPLTNGIPNGDSEDHESKNLKITMTKVGDGVWEQVLKTTTKKRRCNSWKMGKLQKTKKKRKIEQTDHDYTPNYTPPASQSQLVARNDANSFIERIAKSSPPRRRTTPNRLKDCVEVPPSPSKTSPTSALVPPLPSSQINDQIADDSLKALKTSKLRTKSSKKLMTIEAENLLKMPSRTVAKINEQIPGSQVQPLPRVLAIKVNGPVKRPRTNTKKVTSKIVPASNLNAELIAIPDCIDPPTTAVLDPILQNDDVNHQKQSPASKEVKEKKTQKKNVKTPCSTNKTSKKEKISLKVKAFARQKTAKVNTKVVKLTAKAKAICLQIKAEKKKGQTACKAKAKAISKKKEVAINGNPLNKTGAASDNEINCISSCEMPIVANVSPKKMSLISQLEKKNVKTSDEDSKANVYVPSPILPKHLKKAHSASLVTSTASSQSCKNTEAILKTRGRPQLLIPHPVRQRSIRFSRNGIRIGRPPKAKGGSKKESSLVGSQIQFLQSTLVSCFSTSDSAAVDTAKAITSPPDCLLPKNRSNSIRNRLPQSNAQSTNDPLVPHPKAPIALSSYALLPQSSLAANNPKRSSIRQTECAFRYREIAVKKQDNFIQIVLMSSTRVKNGLNCQVMHELSMALSAAKSDPKCSVVVVNGTGSVFCSGVDLISLSMDIGQATAEKTSSAIRDFCKALFTFPKPLIAAVNGAAVGLGVTFLPFFDLVYASDKATFYTPYCKLGQIPEGGATFTLPSIMGYARANALLLEGRRITATEAYDNGLITQVLWPATFMEEVIPRVQALANRPLQAMESTKALIRYHELSKLEVTLDTECRVLLQQWSSDECRMAIRDFLTSEEVV